MIVNLVADLRPRWAFKISYWGASFHGYSRQPGLRTVEGTILEILTDQKIIQDSRQDRFETASRTDRGVSALGNVVSFNSGVDPRRAASLVNACDEDIWFYAYAAVPDNFKPRRARERWYRYYFTKPLLRRSVEAAVPVFLGSHDFGSFSKGKASGVCEVRECRLQWTEDRTFLDIRSDRFLWNMVRRIAACLMMISDGQLVADDLARALEGESLLVTPAPPEGLWLMDVSYEFPFKFVRAKAVERRLRVLQQEASLRERFLEELRERQRGT